MIHRFWTGSPSAHDFKRELEGIHDVPVRDWTPENLPVDLVPLVTMAEPRRASNLIRAALLLRFGGLWVDHDVEPLSKLTLSPTPWTASLRGHREGCVLWFPEPGHPMMATVLGRSLVTPDAVGALILQGVRADDVAHEPRVIPVDSTGRAQDFEGEPMAIHHWASTKGEPPGPPRQRKPGGSNVRSELNARGSATERKLSDMRP